MKIFELVSCYKVVGEIYRQASVQSPPKPFHLQKNKLSLP